ncbi:MAG: methylated-DNA--[protein]-cysteine S-methyltransferase [Candidatus Peribacteraceae bacterium]|nr:methylated-DNA--[protein]-cysteine S-methyltransferase [Candidatus Peribacteraceae bacterium]MDD5741972.1 methylated-DNA--[protein]-cysteine S-methyltransferase [Candidatus Peribacteraceae bacterium]
MPLSDLSWATRHAHVLPAAVQSAAMRQLSGYFAGKRRSFRLSFTLGGTHFERAVYREVRRVPFGRTITYGELARRTGHPRAARAVGTALKKNPLPIIVPCHRVVPACGAPGRYAGGAARKQRLLDLERRHSSSALPRHRSSSSSSSLSVGSKSSSVTTKNSSTMARAVAASSLLRPSMVR